jgi:hypothetical protein
MPLLFTVNGRAEGISRRIDFWQAYRRGSVMIWTYGARSDLRLAWDRSAVRFGYRFRGREVARTDNQEVA